MTLLYDTVLAYDSSAAYDAAVSPLLALTGRYLSRLSGNPVRPIHQATILPVTAVRETPQLKRYLARLAGMPGTRPVYELDVCQAVVSTNCFRPNPGTCPGTPSACPIVLAPRLYADFSSCMGNYAALEGTFLVPVYLTLFQVPVNLADFCTSAGLTDAQLASAVCYSGTIKFVSGMVTYTMTVALVQFTGDTGCNNIKWIESSVGDDTSTLGCNVGTIDPLGATTCYTAGGPQLLYSITGAYNVTIKDITYWS